MAIVRTDDKHYKAIADRLRSYGYEYTVTPAQMPDFITHVTDNAYIRGREDGKTVGETDAYNRFWDALQNNGNVTDYTYAFAGVIWTDDVYSPKHTIKCNSCTNAFRNSRITDTKVDIDISSGVGTHVFNNCQKLVRIPKIIVNKNIDFTGWFALCTELTDLTIEGKIGKSGLDLSASTLLTIKSLNSVIAALEETTTTKTVTLGGKNLTKLTDAEKAAGTQKGWTLV